MDEFGAVRVAVAQVGLGVAVLILAISCWFATAAAVPSLRFSLGVDEGERVALIAIVQAGFAAGAVVAGLARLSDRFAPSRLIPIACLLSAGATVGPFLDDGNMVLLLASRFAVGFLLAGVYPSGMRVIVSWAPPSWSGLAVAGAVAALTLGTAAPYLLDATPVSDWRHVFATCALAAVLAAALSLGLRTGPFAAQAARTVDRSVMHPLREPRQRRITIAYVAHMWEVYGMWVWLPALLAVIPSLGAGGSFGALSFGIIGIAGAIGCLAGGALAGRYGKRRVARWSVAVSALCALATPALPALATPMVIALLVVWSASAISDSPLYSALLGDEAHGSRVGSAIALQMGIGYFVSIGAIYSVSAIAGLVGWQWGFLVLAIGPIVSFFALARPEVSPPAAKSVTTIP